MRPRAIVWFESLYIGTLALGIIQSAGVWKQLTMHAGISMILVIRIISLSVILLLVLLVSRARSNFAKWVLVLCFALGVPLLYHTIKSGHFSGLPIITAVQTVAQIVAMFMLFTPGAHAWLHNRTRIRPGYE